MRFLYSLLIALSLSLGAAGLSAAPAAADPLDDARAAGQIGERPDSYVAVVDASAPALAQAQQAADINGVSERVAVRRDDAFEALAASAAAGERFDVVICDPPAFAKSRKDAEAGLRAYGRLARLAAAVVAPGGFLFLASCSHHAALDAWASQNAFGLFRARGAVDS